MNIEPNGFIDALLFFGLLALLYSLAELILN